MTKYVNGYCIYMQSCYVFYIIKLGKSVLVIFNLNVVNWFTEL